jgi:hypothetical protein
MIVAARTVQGAFEAVLAVARKRWKKAGLVPMISSH